MEAKEFVLDIQTTVLADTEEEAVEILRHFLNEMLEDEDVIQVYGDVIRNIENVKVPNEN